MNWGDFPSEPTRVLLLGSAIVVLAAAYALVLDLLYRFILFPRAKRKAEREMETRALSAERRASLVIPASPQTRSADDPVLCVRVRVAGLGYQNEEDGTYPWLIGDGSIDSRGVIERKVTW